MLTTGEEFIQVLLSELKSEAENFMERVGPGFRFVSRVVSQAQEVVLDLGKFASDAARVVLSFVKGSAIEIAELYGAFNAMAKIFPEK